MKKFLLLCFSFVFVLSSWAQERVVSGQVTSDEDGSTLPGVNVVLKGTTNGTVTDIDGNYRLNVPSAGGTLVFSFIGLQTQEVAIGERSTIDLAMGLDVKQLTEVVVTAQGIERDRKSMGYASTTISASDIANKPETDIGRALQGRTPGLQILNSSGLAGSGSKINIRGISSVSGNTQPLWVVDGVPINTATNDSNQDFRDGQVSPNRFLDIDPNNIETINILRGLSATTLYGSQGRNGVILVTTKTGASGKQSRGFEASVSQSLFAVEAIVPELQNKWGNGFDGDYGEFFSNWGWVFDGNVPPNTPRHPYWEHRNTFPEFPEFQITGGSVDSGYTPTAQPNNVNDFFKKGTSANTSLNVGARNEFGSISFSYSHLDESGFVKGNNLQRDNFSLGGTAKLTDKFSVNSVFNFVRTDFVTPPSGAGQGSNSSGAPSIFSNLFFTPRNIDLTNWPYQNPVTGASVYYRNGNDITNPRWILDNAKQSSLTNRFFSNVAFNYDFTDWFKLTYRLGLDTYSEKQGLAVNKGAVGFPTSAIAFATGLLRTVDITNTILDHSLIGTFQKKLSSDLDLTAIVGGNIRIDELQQSGLESSGQVVFGLQEHRNFANTQPRDFRNNSLSNLNRSQRQIWQGIYFDAGLGYKNFLYMNITGRNDWVSTLEKANNSLFYPGVSASFIPTAAFPGFAAGVLDFLKVRAGYGTSANFPDPYNTRAILNTNSVAQVDALGSVSSQSLDRNLANPDLKPELQSELEFGLEAQLLDNRARVDLSFYNRSAQDQILNRTLDPATGYEQTQINAGEIQNKGIEMGLTVTPVRTNSVVWNIRANYTLNRSEVISLPDGSKEILVSGFTNLGNFAIEGKPFNVIQATYGLRDANGNRLITSNGDYSISPEIGIIGDPNPDWLGSLITDVTWKGITLSAQLDYVHGGDTYSFSAAATVARGVAKDLQDFDPRLPIIIPGVLESDGVTPNNIPMPPSGFFFGNSIIGSNANDTGIFDSSRIRLREVSLSYNIPQSIISKLSIRNANISLVGNNMWFKALNAPKYSKVDFDRTAFGVGNGAGFDFLGGPSARRYGVNLRLTF
ncbi:MAG: SusC/RagA family TonB-linked outer membrane protein [Cyclobacteriaceae bacterium]